MKSVQWGRRIFFNDKVFVVRFKQRIYWNKKTLKMFSNSSPLYPPHLTSVFSLQVRNQSKGYRIQCFGSGFVGSARLWLPGFGSAKICGFTDPDPRGKISTKNCQKKTFLLRKNPYLNFEKTKREIIKISSSEWFIQFQDKNMRKNITKNWKLFFVKIFSKSVKK